MSVDPAFLAKISLFAPLDDDERAVLAQAMVDRQVKPGEVLFRAGEPGDSMFIVVEGGFGTLLEQLQHVLAIEDVERARLGGGRGRGARATVEQ